MVKISKRKENVKHATYELTIEPRILFWSHGALRRTRFFHLGTPSQYLPISCLAACPVANLPLDTTSSACGRGGDMGHADSVRSGNTGSMLQASIVFFYLVAKFNFTIFCLWTWIFMWNGRDLRFQPSPLLFMEDKPETQRASGTAPNLPANQSNTRTRIPFKDSLSNPIPRTLIPVGKVNSGNF